MKQLRMILALLLCVCMLPLSALATTADADGTHETVSYTPETSGLYTVTIRHNGEILPIIFVGVEPETNIDVNLTDGTVAAQEVDFNVFYLNAGTEYTVQLDNQQGYFEDNTGEWTVSVDPITPQALALNAVLAEGEWFSFSPEQDGDYSFYAAAGPAFVEIYAPGTQGGDWEGFAKDKQIYRQGLDALSTGYMQYDAAKQDYDRARATLESNRAAYELAKQQYDAEKAAYDKALAKLDAYQQILDAANERGFLDGSNYDSKKQLAYNAFLLALRAGSLIGLNIDREILNNLPERYTELPAYLTEQIQENEAIKTRFETTQANAEAQLAEFEAAEKQLAEAEATLQQAEAMLAEGETKLQGQRDLIQADADAIMGGAGALAADANGLALQAASWLDASTDNLTAALAAGTTYTVHVLSEEPAAVRVTNDPAENPVVDKSALEQAIKDALSMDPTAYTDASAAAFLAALQAAQSVMSAPGATQEQVNAAVKALNDAIAGLETPTEATVDKSALQQAINAAEAIDTSKFTEDSVAKLNEALEAAKAVVNNDDADQDAVDAAANALNDAIKALKPTSSDVDKTALNEAIERAEAIDRSKYTESTLSALDIALAAAKRLADSSIATQGMVDFAANTLNAAIDALEKLPQTTVDKSALEEAIAAAQAVDRSKYTSESLSAMDSKLNYAQAVLGDDDATQADVDAAANALNDAVKALKEKEVTPTVDKSKLQEAISKAEAIDTSKYTDETVAALNQALTTAKAVLGADSVPQAGVDNAAKALNDAIAGLKEKDVTPPAPGVDKTALQQAVDKAKAIDRTKYTDDSLAALDLQLQNAEALLANANATQTQVNLATRRVNSALSALKEKTAPQPVKFVDVPENAYYADAVDWAVQNGITNGKDATHFAPKDDCTRAQIVTFLWRTAGEPEPTTTTNPFVDVSPSAYYYKAVLWAVGEEITNGTDATHFSPNATCTRAHAVTFLWRMEGEPMPSSIRSTFVDVQDANAYYYYAVMWAVEKGITNGTDNNHFSPKQNCSRAQIVTFLYRDKVGA